MSHIFGHDKTLNQLFDIAAPLALSFLAPGIGTALGAGSMGTLGIGAGLGALGGAGAQAMTGGKPLVGAIEGGLGGALGGGGGGGMLGDALGIGTMGGAALGGGAAGGLGSALSGQNPLTGALEGAASGALASGISGAMSGAGGTGETVSPTAGTSTAGAGAGAAATSAPTGVDTGWMDTTPAGVGAPALGGVSTPASAGTIVTGGGSMDNPTGWSNTTNISDASAVTNNAPSNASLGAGSPPSTGNNALGPYTSTTPAPAGQGGTFTGNNPITAPAGGAPQADSGLLSQIFGSGAMSTMKELAPFAALAPVGLSALTGNKNLQGQSGLASMAGNAQSQGQALSQYLQTGTLPAGVQQGINQASNAAKASIRSRYASMGQEGSSAMQQDLANVDAQAQAQGAQIATSLLQQGTNLTGMSAGIYERLMANAAAQNQQLGSSIGNFAKALAGGDSSTATGVTK